MSAAVPIHLCHKPCNWASLTGNILPELLVLLVDSSSVVDKNAIENVMSTNTGKKAVPTAQLPAAAAPQQAQQPQQAQPTPAQPVQK